MKPEDQEVYGDAAAYAEHQAGEQITYIEDGRICRGTIVYVCAPTVIAGKHVPTQYAVEPTHRTGFPDFVRPGDIVERQL